MGLGSSTTKPALQTVSGPIDIPRFMGRWYVIGCKPTYFEIGAANAVEEYTWNKERDCIDINFTFNKGSVNGPPQKIPQTGFIFNKTTNSEWRVSPMWPLKLPFLVIELGPEVLPDPYSYTVIGYPSRDYVWIMGRKKDMEEELYNSILQRLEKDHLYNLDGLNKRSSIFRFPHDCLIILLSRNSFRESGLPTYNADLMAFTNEVVFLLLINFGCKSTVFRSMSYPICDTSS
eukprot:gene529-1006_t